MSTNKEFRQILRALLMERGMTQAELCRLTEIPTSLMSNYLSGKKSPALSNAILISEALHVSLDELSGRAAIGASSKSIENIETDSFDNFTPHEVKVMVAYRKQPAMQPAVDKLLGVEDAEKSESRAIG